nr:efflux RND transporter periplasmic adaptor subunit [uncultured Desulfobulbus sp.]
MNTPAFYSLPPILLLLICLMVSGCQLPSEQKANKKKRPAIAVVTTKSSTMTIPVELEATGYAEAEQSVAIRSQVNGELQAVHIQEGQMVNQGDLLFSIDPRPFVAELAKAKAQLEKNQADLEKARRDRARYTPAATKGLVSKEQADEAATRVRTLTAAIQADKASVTTAQLALEYCSIRAPFSGRSGEIHSDPGNLIKANADEPMVILKSLDPILVRFSLPGRHLKSIFKEEKNNNPLKVIVHQDQEQPGLEGSLVFTDNTVDTNTGEILLKARIDNKSHLLWPGKLVRITLHLRDEPDVVVVPSQAVQTGQQGEYLFVVDTTQRSRYRPVETTIRWEHYTVISKGLKAGERVVIDGQLLLEDGSTVQEHSAVAQQHTSGQP